MPRDLAEQFERVNWDPVRNKPRFASKALFLRAALAQFVANQPLFQKQSEELLNAIGKSESGQG